MSFTRQTAALPSPVLLSPSTSKPSRATSGPDSICFLKTPDSKPARFAAIDGRTRVSSMSPSRSIPPLPERRLAVDTWPFLEHTALCSEVLTLTDLFAFRRGLLRGHRQNTMGRSDEASPDEKETRERLRYQPRHPMLAGGYRRRHTESTKSDPVVVFLTFWSSPNCTRGDHRGDRDHDHFPSGVHQGW